MAIVARIKFYTRNIKNELGIFSYCIWVNSLAELGDKTQLATILFASNESSNKLIVLIAASCALIAVTALSVLAGAAISNYVGADALKRIAGVGFIVIGVLNIFSK